MQTFLPYSSFELSARVLDSRRLGKQRLEAWQILRVLLGETNGWIRHPAVRMWRGCEHALVEYGRAICIEWRCRGYADTMLERFDGLRPVGQLVLPVWLGTPEFHATHRAVLLAKEPAWYGRFGWSERAAVPNANGRFHYIWPKSSLWEVFDDRTERRARARACRCGKHRAQGRVLDAGDGRGGRRDRGERRADHAVAVAQLGGHGDLGGGWLRCVADEVTTAEAERRCL